MNQYLLNNSSITLTSDLAGEFPLYLYLSDDKKSLLYSKNIVELLDDNRVQKPLKVSDKGMSFLLQNGVVPPPLSIYQNIFIVSIGDSVKVSTKGSEVNLDFSHEFPFFNKHRLNESEMTPDIDYILDVIAEATIKRIDPSKPTFLFHSAGKDSNMIALALAKAGYQDKVTLITHKSKGDKDESEISKSLAKKLGFKHKILYEVDKLEQIHKNAIDEYFTNAPFPCTDNVTLAYPLYLTQLPELRNANIIDGGGNDVYMMAPPSKRDIRIIPISRVSSRFSFLRNIINSESLLTPLLRTPAEWFGLNGLSFKDSKAIFLNSYNVYDYWEKESNIRENWDIFDFKTDILTTVVASELHIRKFRNFVDVIGANAVLPFANEKVVNYFAKMPEEYLFDRKGFKNKFILREILKEKIDLNSDKLGKMGWVYDKYSIVFNNLQLIKDEVLKSTIWNEVEINSLFLNFEKNIFRTDRIGMISKSWIYRLYLISAWYNKNKYLNVKVTN